MTGDIEQSELAKVGKKTEAITCNIRSAHSPLTQTGRTTLREVKDFRYLGTMCQLNRVYWAFAANEYKNKISSLWAFLKALMRSNTEVCTSVKRVCALTMTLVLDQHQGAIGHTLQLCVINCQQESKTFMSEGWGTFYWKGNYSSSEANNP